MKLADVYMQESGSREYTVNRRETGGGVEWVECQSGYKIRVLNKFQRKNTLACADIQKFALKLL